MAVLDDLSAGSVKLLLATGSLLLGACSGDDGSSTETASTDSSSTGSTGSSGSTGSTSGTGSTGSPGTAGATDSGSTTGTTTGTTDSTGSTGSSSSGGATSTGSSGGGSGTAGSTSGGAQCTPKEAAACDPNASCSIGGGGVAQCICDGGWTGPGNICVNENECTDNTHNCDTNASCSDTQGSFECSCNEYYAGDGQFCFLIDPTVYVADVTDRPIQIEISGVGTYDIHGMGRLAVEFNYTTMAGAPPFLADNTPTGWLIHDLVMRNITAQPGSDIQDLAAWSQTITAQSAVITLDGLGAELLALAMVDVVPVSADPTVSVGSMAELVVSIAGPEHPTPGTYTPPFQTGFPGNSTLMEVEGVSNGPALLPPDITEAADGTADSIELRKIGRQSSFSAEAYMEWMEDAIRDFGAFGDIARRALSQIHLDASAQEIDRVNCFETFPSLLYYFNPAKTYGTSFLIDVLIPTELCEQG